MASWLMPRMSRNARPASQLGFARGPPETLAFIARTQRHCRSFGAARNRCAAMPILPIKAKLACAAAKLALAAWDMPLWIYRLLQQAMLAKTIVTSLGRALERL